MTKWGAQNDHTSALVALPRLGDVGILSTVRAAQRVSP